jgi:hypothetical protein
VRPAVGQQGGDVSLVGAGDQVKRQLIHVRGPFHAADGQVPGDAERRAAEPADFGGGELDGGVESLPVWMLDADALTRAARRM